MTNSPNPNDSTTPSIYRTVSLPIPPPGLHEGAVLAATGAMVAATTPDAHCFLAPADSVFAAAVAVAACASEFLPRSPDSPAPALPPHPRGWARLRPESKFRGTQSMIEGYRIGTDDIVVIVVTPDVTTKAQNDAIHFVANKHAYLATIVDLVPAPSPLPELEQPPVPELDQDSML